MSDFKVSVGNVEIISLSDGAGENLMKNVFPGVSPTEWKRYPDFISPEGKLKSNYGCFAIRSGGKTILVDTGIGPGYPGRLLDELREKGIDLNEINVNRQGSGVNIQFDPIQTQNFINQGIIGFTPIIINITPIQSIMPLLGLDTTNSEEPTEKVSRIDPFYSDDPLRNEEFGVSSLN